MQNGNQEEEKREEVRLVAHEGDSVALIIPQGFIKELGWEEGSEVTVEVISDRIVISPAQGRARAIEA